MWGKSLSYWEELLDKYYLLKELMIKGFGKYLRYAV